MNKIILALLGSLSAPLLLLPIEKIIPCPSVLEELVKLLIAVSIINSEKERKNNLVGWVVLAGFFFTVSESIFYLTNIFSNGNLLLFPQRILLTGTLHIFTMLAMYYLGKKNLYLLSAGYGLAVVTHWLFNLAVKNAY